jgi:hypothetical protein
MPAGAAPSLLRGAGQVHAGAGQERSSIAMPLLHVAVLIQVLEASENHSIMQQLHPCTAYRVLCGDLAAAKLVSDLKSA